MDNLNLKYAFIGGGNMGRAMASALIGQGVALPGGIVVVEPDSENRSRIEKMGCLTLEKADEPITQARTVVLAVKPQEAGKVFKEIKPFLHPDQVVVSIMAGITMKAMKKGLGHQALVRVMPNTPSQVGLGMSAYFADKSVSEEQLTATEDLLKSSGEALAVKSEDAIDAATAISGSGPAYVFYMAEHWMAAAGKMGFTTEQAEQLVQQTLIGATALWREMRVDPATLRKQVTSKGGTTAAALEHFDKKSIGGHFEKGLEQAYKRAKELGK